MSEQAGALNWPAKPLQPNAHLASRILEIAEDEQAKAGDYLEEFVTMRYWLSADTFDCDRLALYAVGDERGLDADQEVLHP